VPVRERWGTSPEVRDSQGNSDPWAVPPRATAQLFRVMMAYILLLMTYRSAPSATTVPWTECSSVSTMRNPARLTLWGSITGSGLAGPHALDYR
jgi:hypothetical protein